MALHRRPLALGDVFTIFGTAMVAVVIAGVGSPAYVYGLHSWIAFKILIREEFRHGFSIFASESSFLGFYRPHISNLLKLVS